MLNAIRNFFEAHLQNEADEDDPEHAVRLAVAALLIEMMRMDGDLTTEQRDAINIAVRDCFELENSEVTELLELAEAERNDATDYFQFTQLINEHFDMPKRIKLIETLWRIAYANESLHVHEEHLARKLANLLYIPHSAFIRAKHAASG